MIKQRFYFLESKSDRLDYLISHYKDIEQIIHRKKQSLAYIVSNERSYARKKKNEGLGISIIRTSDIVSHTEMQAIEHVLVMESIKEGKLKDSLIEEGVDTDLINKTIFDINLLTNEYHLLSCHLEGLPPESKKIFIPYLNKQATIDTVAKKYVIEHDSAKTKLYRIRKKLKEMVLPYMENYTREDI